MKKDFQYYQLLHETKYQTRGKIWNQFLKSDISYHTFHKIRVIQNIKKKPIQENNKKSKKIINLQKIFELFISFQKNIPGKKCLDKLIWMIIEIEQIYINIPSWRICTALVIEYS